MRYFFDMRTYWKINNIGNFKPKKRKSSVISQLLNESRLSGFNPKNLTLLNLPVKISFFKIGATLHGSLLEIKLV